MEYQKIYNNIIEKARNENRIKLQKTNINYVYYERHHIFPRCLGGGDEKENLVLLTAKEHFICHKLLIKIYPDNRDLSTAYHFMVYGNNDYKNTSRDYKYARELISGLGLSEETKRKISEFNKGKTHTLESRIKMSEALKGKPAPNKGGKMPAFQKKKISDAHKGKKLSDETKKKMSEARRGKKLSDETKKKMSEARRGKLNPMAGKTGENNPNYGSKRSEETKSKISKGNIGKKRTPEHIRKYKMAKKNISPETKKKISESLKKRNSLKS
jgi:hypothetical protein